jgi:hypothetical protein
MAADQVPAQTGQAEPTITRIVRTVTQPGGKDINWQWVRAVGVIIGAVAVAHGAKTRTWRYIHSVATVLAVGGATAAYLKNKFVDSAGAPESK